jgi:DNA primase
MIPLLIENLQTGIKRFQPAKTAYTSQNTQGYTRKPSISLGESPQVESLEIDYPDEPHDDSNRAVELTPTAIHPSQRLVEQAESLLLRIYLHYPIYRLTIIDELDSANLEFTLAHHRFLWQQIIDQASSNNLSDEPDREVDYLDEKLIVKLQDLAIEYPSRNAQIKHLFHLDEHTAEEIQRSPLVLRAAIACLEKSTCERKCQEYLNKLKSQDPEDLANQKENLQSFMAIKQRLQQLQQQRTVTIADLISF